ncbi:hypothetical protein GGS23DRAFT_100800 [Durotheca rogersii]|uniref:uncharacterized protein n=1 Tax=Durotheca rogersii TaxID=419775 RepID=UPI00221F1749|nr:uncharacterized protein GGS23DRAFT_100800 [Durotheca rogersii]KAI5862443.1 hypothetical protein GGS23DRAFT_100800 [Durotheca rogersii]
MCSLRAPCTIAEDPSRLAEEPAVPNIPNSPSSEVFLWCPIVDVETVLIAVRRVLLRSASTHYACAYLPTYLPTSYAARRSLGLSRDRGPSTSAAFYGLDIMRASRPRGRDAGARCLARKRGGRRGRDIRTPYAPPKQSTHLRSSICPPIYLVRIVNFYVTSTKTPRRARRGTGSRVRRYPAATRANQPESKSPRGPSDRRGNKRALPKRQP